MSLPSDYLERVYAGVLGKVIGVYLGRPFEGWTYDQIMERLGEITYYVHERLQVPLIVTDDDISGTFTFLRAFSDYGNRLHLTPAQIGQTWLNYLIERRTILWWGGMGNSTEHTAYLRLKHGMVAPESGSIATNGKVVAEQIGAQIFVDGWAMVAPGDPALAADLARRAASVSHDGEAIYGAQVLAAMEAQAFVEPEINKLIDCAVGFIPKDSIIYRLIGDIRNWHAREPDWRKTREQIAGKYGYDKYGGNCHMVPNHALIIHALLHGNDDFQQSLMIVNTSGWDTDCNSGNVGCLLGIKNGLAGLDTGPDWRGPVADRMYLPTADGGRAITDAATEAVHVVNIGRALAGVPPLQIKDGARFHFELPGSLQGFEVEASVESSGTATLANVVGRSKAGTRSLAIRYQGLARSRTMRARTPTFIPSKDIATHFEKRGYPLLASPSLHPGQTVRAALWADAANAKPITCTLQVSVYAGPEGELMVVDGPHLLLEPGVYGELTWQIDELQSRPIAFVGVQLSSNQRADGTVYLDYLRWDGEPNVVFTRPPDNGEMWHMAWVNGVDQCERWWPESFRLAQNEGRGLLIQGGREWRNYTVSGAINLHLARAAGIAARVQGLRRYYALLLTSDSEAQLVRVCDGETVLARAAFLWQHGSTHDFTLRVEGARLLASIDGQQLFDVEDAGSPLDGGGVALVCEEGRISCEAVTVQP